MGRAIVRKPQVFLFDEPLSNLDAKLRVAMRTEIKALHQRLKTTSIYVTHDQIEAMTMADRIVVMNAGRVAQIGSPLQLYDDPANRFVAGFIGSPAMNFLPARVAGVTATEFYELIASEFRLGLSSTASKPERLSTLTRFLATRHSKGLRTVLIADEAHGLATNVLEEIRLLANLETNTEKLLQIVLCGQPELRDKLNQPDLRQLKQRVALRCSIKPLGSFEIDKYIRFRLRTAGAERMDIFDEEAVDLISRVSLGIPRVINNICDNALLHGYAAEREIIGVDIIRGVIETLDISTNDMTTGEPSDFETWMTPRINGVSAS